jgi:hypothetical protein
VAAPAEFIYIRCLRRTPNMSNRETRKDYTAPKIVHTEVLSARATTCAKADASCTTGAQTGPLQS